MRAITVKKPGGVEQLQISEQPIPEVKEGELLIKVTAAAINRTDIINRQGPSYLENPILGVEVSGQIVALGSESPFEIGAFVMGLVNGGAYAEYVAMPANRAMLIPKTISHQEAAAIPEVFLTAYQTLFWIADLQPQERVLIHAGGSGVGTAAIQLAKVFGQAHVYTTAGSAEKLAFARALGADLSLNYRTEIFSEKLLTETKEGVDVILDFIGASYWQQNFESIALDGRWVLIGTLGGAEIPTFNIGALMAKRIQLTGTLLTPRSDDYKARLTAEFSQHILPLFAAKKIQPIIDSFFPFEEIQAAHQHMEDNKNIGKIVLTLS